MTTTDRMRVEKWRRALGASFPIMGRIRRRRAIRELAARRDEPQIVPVLIDALGSTDTEVAVAADTALRGLTSPPAIDALCEAAAGDPAGAAAKVCVETGRRHSDHEKNCLYLFVTRQFDAYFGGDGKGGEDFEFQALRLEYDRADERVKGHVMDVVRSGDRRCAGFFASGGGGEVGAKPLAECTDAEIKLALDSWVRHGQWERLFHACLELPLKYSWAALEPLRTSGWQPQMPDLASVLKQVLADSDGRAVPARREPSAESSLFEGWLQGGRSGELASASEPDLLKRLESGKPAASVAAVAALAAKARPGSDAAKAVAGSPHWLVRLAGQVTGLTMDLARDQEEDPNWWVNELATASSVLEFWPGRATPADLERLSEAPKEAWAGRLGAARKVLRTVMGHRVTTGTFEPMVIEADELAGEFVVAGDAEFADMRGDPAQENDS